MVRQAGIVFARSHNREHRHLARLATAEQSTKITVSARLIGSAISGVS